MMSPFLTGSSPGGKMMFAVNVSLLYWYSFILAAAAGINRSRCPYTVVKPLGWFRSEEHTSELQSLMRISYAVFCLKKKKKSNILKNKQSNESRNHYNTL